MADEEEDYFAPPSDPVEVFCLHCGNVYRSDEIIFAPRADGPSCVNGVHGDWMCPAPGCNGVGYHFDIHSVEEWESNGEANDESFIDNDELFVVENEFDDDFAAECPFDLPSDMPDYLPAGSDDLESAFDESLDKADWLETHDYPFVRIWQMRLDFCEHRTRYLSEDTQQTYEPFNEDDIPF